jgi:hypothetical protein
MKTYYVSIPFTGYTVVVVEAETEKEAIEKAWDSPDLTISKAEEAEFHDKVTYGNVCSAVLNEISVDEAGE